MKNEKQKLKMLEKIVKVRLRALIVKSVKLGEKQRSQEEMLKINNSHYIPPRNKTLRSHTVTKIVTKEIQNLLSRRRKIFLQRKTLLIDFAINP